MIRRRKPDSGVRHWKRLLLQDNAASQLVEFAVALPLLVVFVVGIFDFSNAFTLKQKLTNIARDAVRAAAVDPINDLQNPAPAVPVSVTDAFQMIDSYLLASNTNDCAISPTPTSSSGLTWVFNGTGNGCIGTGLTITVNRGYYFPAAGASPPNVNCTPQDPAGQLAVISTCVSIQYAYPWRFGEVASLLRATTVLLPTQISATAVAMNEN